MTHEHIWKYYESETKAFCSVCGQGSSHEFWKLVDQGKIKDKWRS